MKLVEVIYNQDAELVDYSNPLKIYKPAQDSSSKDENTAADAEQDAQRDEREEQLPQNRDDEGSPQQEAPQASPGNQRHDSPAGNQDGRDEALQPGTSGSSGGAQSGGSQSGSEGADEVTDSSEDSDKPVNPAERGSSFDARTGVLEGLPQCATLAASAELAEVVAVLAGPQALVAAPEAFTSNSGAAKLGLSAKARTAFSGTGLEAGSADLKAIKAAHPGGLLVSNDSRAFTQEQLDSLQDAGIDVIKVPSMRSASGMRTCADIVGSVVPGARAKADSYLRFYDATLATAQKMHGGGYAKGDDYDASTKGAAAESPKTTYSLYISNWDADAKVTARAYDAVFFTQTGAAYTYRGPDWSPLASFMSAGGVVNNAADYIWGASMVPVLEYNENTVTYSWSKLDIATGAGGGGGLAGKKSGNAKVLTNSADGTHMLGDEEFPAVIVKSASIKAALEKARSKAAPGLYTMWGDTGNGVVGARFKGQVVRAYCRSGAGGAYQVLINPAGFMGSWADGGLESVMESLWTACTFYKGGDCAELERCVRSYYSEFYGYQLKDAELAAIVSGALAK